jgi:hypothetical protein
MIFGNATPKSTAKFRCCPKLGALICIDTYEDLKQSVSAVKENLKGSQKQHNTPNTTPITIKRMEYVKSEKVYIARVSEYVLPSSDKLRLAMRNFYDARYEREQRVEG